MKCSENLLPNNNYKKYIIIIFNNLYEGNGESLKYKQKPEIYLQKTTNTTHKKHEFVDFCMRAFVNHLQCLLWEPKDSPAEDGLYRVAV